MGDPTRRQILEGGVILAGAPLLWGFGPPPVLARPGGGAGKSVRVIPSRRFRVAIKGLYSRVPGVILVDPGRVDFQWKKKAGGYVLSKRTFSGFRLQLRRGSGMAKLKRWAEQAKAPRRDLSIYLLGKDLKKPLRTINCFGCFPTSFDAGSHSTSSDIKTITLTCNIDRIEVA